MWYDDLGVISIGEHCGGPEDGGLGDMKIDLWRLFLRHCKSTYCPAVAHYALLLIVGGEFQKFGSETFEPPRRNRKHKTVEVHMIIPEFAWRSRNRNALRDYLAKLVKKGIELCVACLVKDGESVVKTSLFREVDEAIERFLAIDYESACPSSFNLVQPPPARGYPAFYPKP